MHGGARQLVDDHFLSSLFLLRTLKIGVCIYVLPLRYLFLQRSSFQALSLGVSLELTRGRLDIATSVRQMSPLSPLSGV